MSSIRVVEVDDILAGLDAGIRAKRVSSNSVRLAMKQVRRTQRKKR